MRTLISEVEAELATANVNFIDLWKLDLGSVTLRWSSKEIPATITHDGYEYEPRVFRVGTLPYKPDFDDQKTDFEFDNSDNIVKTLGDLGIHFENARCDCIRLLPDLTPPTNIVGTWDDPLWSRWVSKS